MAIFTDSTLEMNLAVSGRLQRFVLDDSDKAYVQLLFSGFVDTNERLEYNGTNNVYKKSKY